VQSIWWTTEGVEEKFRKLYRNSLKPVIRPGGPCSSRAGLTAAHGPEVGYVSAMLQQRPERGWPSFWYADSFGLLVGMAHFIFCGAKSVVLKLSF
jgi:hypothetical protein